MAPRSISTRGWGRRSGWGWGLASAQAAILLLGLLPAGCFDSDEKFVPAAGSTSTTGPMLTTTGDSTTTTGGSGTTEDADRTCREAIECVSGCAVQLQLSMLPEPDFTCFLECEQGMTSQEVLDLFRLTECVTNECIELDQCDILVPSDTTTGGESSSGGESSGTGDTDGTRPPLCLNCVLGRLLEDSLGGQCAEFAAACQ